MTAAWEPSTVSASAHTLRPRRGTTTRSPPAETTAPAGIRKTNGRTTRARTAAGAPDDNPAGVSSRVVVVRRRVALPRVRRMGDLSEFVCVHPEDRIGPGEP